MQIAETFHISPIEAIEMPLTAFFAALDYIDTKGR
jgi:hypothetical protein